MQLTRFTDYGLRCLMYLAARPDDLSSVKEISEYYKISRNHLVKIVHRLSQLGYIEPARVRAAASGLLKKRKICGLEIL
jgi:Rrf2 family nitric oxide-sensitive transcriptional repressor